MNRLLIAATCALGSCAAPDARLERELGSLAASVRMLETRVAAEALHRPTPREYQPPRDPAGRRRFDHAPAGPLSPVDREPDPAPRRAVPSARAADGPDPVAELAAEVARLRAALRAKPARDQQQPAAEVRTPEPAAPPTAVIGPAPDPRRGRFQVAGSGQSAWQTVLDTHTGVIYNFRSVGGRSVWVPITTPVPTATPR